MTGKELETVVEAEIMKLKEDIVTAICGLPNVTWELEHMGAVLAVAHERVRQYFLEAAEDDTEYDREDKAFFRKAVNMQVIKAIVNWFKSMAKGAYEERKAKEKEAAKKEDSVSHVVPFQGGMDKAVKAEVDNAGNVVANQHRPVPPVDVAGY